jgi:hypothetical protein
MVRISKKFLVLTLSLLLVTAWIQDATAAPRTLLPEPKPAPNGVLAANVQWDEAGFVGLLSMRIYDKSGKFLRSVDVPEINPSPANLLWLDDEWVACDSFIGHNGSGFYYVHAPSGRGYLLEIVAPDPRTDWIFSAASSDAVSSASIANISRGRTSLFPILLRTVPDNEAGFFMADFVREVAVAIETYNAYRKQRGISRIDILSDADIETSHGAIFVAQVDGRAEVIYFPAGESAAEMFNRVKRYPLPANIQAMLKESPPPDLRVKWQGEGKFIVQSFTAPQDGVTSSPVTVAQGRLENISDKSFAGKETTGTIEKPESSPDEGEDDALESGPGDPKQKGVTPNFYEDSESSSTSGDAEDP